MLLNGFLEVAMPMPINKRASRMRHFMFIRELNLLVKLN